MVSPVRIRVPPLLKVLQNPQKQKDPGKCSGISWQQYGNSRNYPKALSRAAVAASCISSVA
jgi:hypothetical protein